MIVRSIEAKGAGELPPAGYAMNTVKMEESERQQWSDDSGDTQGCPEKATLLVYNLLKDIKSHDRY